MKVVINRCYGGFGLSFEACKLIAKRKGWTLATDDWGNDYWLVDKQRMDYYDLDRTDLDLVAAVEELGENACGYAADLKIVSIPDDVKWFIHEYDGMEVIREEHRSWF